MIRHDPLGSKSSSQQTRYVLATKISRFLPWQAELGDRPAPRTFALNCVSSLMHKQRRYELSLRKRLSEAPGHWVGETKPHFLLRLERWRSEKMAMT